MQFLPHVKILPLLFPPLCLSDSALLKFYKFLKYCTDNEIYNCNRYIERYCLACHLDKSFCCSCKFYDRKRTESIGDTLITFINSLVSCGITILTAAVLFLSIFLPLAFLLLLLLQSALSVLPKNHREVSP